MPTPLVILLGKAVKRAAQLRGGGSALPGLFIETIDKNFIRNSLSSLPDGVILISGTNGKTTTTKMIVELLEGQGKRVFTNRTGSNFTRGVAAALISAIDMRGALDADIAVLELDEAHAVHFVKAVRPNHTLLLNVMRDQLDRFGEIDATAKLLEVVAQNTERTVVINREDPRLLELASRLPKSKVRFFGLDRRLHGLFPSDDDMRSGSSRRSNAPKALGVLESISGSIATMTVHGQSHDVRLKLEGAYNVYNSVAAAAIVAAILENSLDHDKLVRSLEAVTPAFGRGEKLMVGGHSLELVLVKNPGGFRLGLSSFDPAGYATMIAVNDNYADGRDMSWLWDVDFDKLRTDGVACVGGVRAFDMALRLQYEDVGVKDVEPVLATALRKLISGYPNSPKRIYCTYTAMLALRKELAKITEVTTVS